MLDKRAMRESDLLAFEIGITDSDVGAVMCSYNMVNGDYACENDYLLNEVLEEGLRLPGLCHVGLGRHAQHRKAAHGRARHRDAGQRLSSAKR